MIIHTFFAVVFLWILINMFQSYAAFGCTNTVKKDSGISFHSLDFLRKVQNLRSNGSELLEGGIGLLLKEVVYVVNTSLSLVLFRERQMADFIKMWYQLYFHSFQNMHKN